MQSRDTAQPLLALLSRAFSGSHLSSGLNLFNGMTIANGSEMHVFSLARPVVIQ